MTTLSTHSLAQLLLNHRSCWQPAKHVYNHAHGNASSSQQDAADNGTEDAVDNGLTPAFQPTAFGADAPTLSTVEWAKIANAARHRNLPMPSVLFLSPPTVDKNSAIIYLNHNANTRFAVAYQHRRDMLWFLHPPRKNCKHSISPDGVLGNHSLANIIVTLLWSGTLWKLAPGSANKIKAQHAAAWSPAPTATPRRTSARRCHITQRPTPDLVVDDLTKPPIARPPTGPI